MIKKVSFLLILFFLCAHLFSQNKYDKSFYLIDIKADFVFDPSEKHNLDSLLQIYHATKNDTTQLQYLQFFSERLTSEYLWTSYNRYLYEYSSRKNDSLYKCFKAYALNNLGYESQYIKNNLEDAKKFYYQSYEIFKALKHVGGIGAEINNLAYIYQHEGNTQKALELYTEAGLFFEKQKLALGLTSVYINLGGIYYKNDDFEKAEEFFNKALVYAIKTDQKSVIANAYFQLGTINSKNNHIEKAITYFEKAAINYQKENNYGRLALVDLGLGNIYYKIKDSLQFEQHALKSLSNSLLSSDLQTKAKIYDFVALYYMSKKDYNKAFMFADSSYQFAKALVYPELIADAAEKLSNIYKYKGNYNLAYSFLQEMKTIEDSLKTDASKKAIIKSQYQLEYNKKSIELTAEQDKKDSIRKAEKRQQQIILLLTVIALIIITVFGFIAFKNYKKTKKANVIIENQKLQVELKNEEITHQKELVDEKQKEIIDSINYAKRIQQAVLTGEDVWNKISKEHFILFKPKDIVSGDFYWAYNTPNNRSVFALADCTGHGVPGGFMSMLGNSFLNEIVVENKIFKADQILNKLRAKIIHALEQKGGTQQKDGMDMSLCVWNKLDNTLEFSGANNPLWLLRTVVSSSGVENKELLEYKADKMPIGLYLDEEKPFSSVTIQLQKGDIIYLSTDGYADQFGGPKGKKLKYKPLIDSLIRNSTQDMVSQKVSLETAFINWKSTHDQVDDVSLIGVKVV
ncbi:MAG: tetratricopeptide repeat protein [Bacteroidota bacterium]